MEILIALGFVLFTFILETVILAANDWKVCGKTPVYYWVYSRTNNPEFCSMFWQVLGTYLLGAIVVFITISTVVGWVSVIYGVRPSNIITALGMMLGTGVLFLFGVFIILGVVGVSLEAAVDKVRQSDVTFTKGITNWYSQFKDKYCPILEEDDE